MKRRGRTVQIVPASAVPADATLINPGPPVAEPEPGTQETLDLLARAAAHPLSREEVIFRLGALLRRDFNYKQYRRRNGQYTAYDELLEQSMEAVASAVFYLQQGAQP